MYQSTTYKWCAVPRCNNNSKRTSNKLFVNVPRNAELRKKWLELAKRNPLEIMSKSSIFFCEDHFDLEKDMENYMQYKMGFSQKVIMVRGVLPSKFDCQESAESSPTYIKRIQLNLVKESETGIKLIKENVDMCDNVLQKTNAESRQTHHDKGINTDPIGTAEKSVQILVKEKDRVHYRSETIQTSIATRTVSISPFKHATKSSFTSLFENEQCPVEPSKSGVTSVKIHNYGIGN